MITDEQIHMLGVCAFYSSLVEKIGVINSRKSNQKLERSELEKYKTLLTLINKACKEINWTKLNKSCVERSGLEIVEKSMLKAKLVVTDGGAINTVALIDELWLIIREIVEIYVTGILTQKSISILTPFLDGVSNAIVDINDQIIMEQNVWLVE